MTRLIVLFFLLMFLGCEVNTTVSISKEIPPKFTVHGTGGIYYLRVYDFTDPKSMEGDWWKTPGIWEIAHEKGGVLIRSLPQITYGEVPAGFIQKTPSKGKPPALIEGRRYWVWTPSFNANGGGSNSFMIENGKVIEIN